VSHLTLLRQFNGPKFRYDTQAVVAALADAERRPSALALLGEIIATMQAELDRGTAALEAAQQQNTKRFATVESFRARIAAGEVEVEAPLARMLSIIETAQAEHEELKRSEESAREFLKGLRTAHEAAGGAAV